ncbi:hypothetical protein TB2_014696 [Malus domestica]
MYCLITNCLVHSSSIHSFRELESRVVKLAFAKLLESVADTFSSRELQNSVIKLPPKTFICIWVIQNPSSAHLSLIAAATEQQPVS